MKRTIIAAIIGFGIAIPALPAATTAVAEAATLSGTGISTSMPFCTPWLIEHAKPCLPAPPVHRRDHDRVADCQHGRAARHH